MADNQEMVAAVTGVLDSLLRGDLDEAEPALKRIIEGNPDKECLPILGPLQNLIDQFREGIAFINAISSGDLDYPAPHHFYLYSHYKQLQSNLRYLAWQTQQIAKGDYKQSVNFMGDFSVSFNQLIEGLKEKKRFQDQLVELSATRDKFFSIISHDLKSPFNAILGFSDLLEQDYEELDDRERKEYIHNIRESARNAFKLLENLLEWSRLQTGKIAFVSEDLSISRLVLENFLLLKPLAQKKNIHLFSRVSIDLMARGDLNSVLTILRNLISNAIKFTPAGGKVTVEAEENNRMVFISVKDTGVGISEANITRLFVTGESFKTTGTDNEKGTGLGLILCREFAEKNGGSIKVTSEEGKGSCFTFSLPGISS